MKRFICIILAGLMCFGILGCRGEAAPADKPAEPTDTPIPETLPIESPPDDSVERGPHTTDTLIVDPVPPRMEIIEDWPVSDYNDFSDLFTYAALKGASENYCVSPVSLYLALAMTAGGADNETLAQFLQLMGAQDVAELGERCRTMAEAIEQEGDEAVIKLANSLWMAEKVGDIPVTFYEDFLNYTKDNFAAEPHLADFTKADTASLIEQWISDRLNGAIKPELDFMPDTLIALINTIYLKDSWADGFKEDGTEAGDFTLQDGTTMSADFMFRKKHTTVAKGEGFTRVVLPLSNIGSMSFILPDEGVSIDELLATPETTGEAINGGSAQTYDLSLRLPKFAFSSKAELSPLLQRLGLLTAFSMNFADFSKLSNIPAYIGSVIQETKVEVNEMGVEAAAYTIISMRTTATVAEVPAMDLSFDRPFAFAISSRDGTVLFTGVVYVPTAAEAK